MKSFNSCQRGFTFIEMAVVVAIAGILAAVAIPQYLSHTQKSKERAATGDVAALSLVLENEYQSNLQYPQESNFNGSTNVSAYKKWAPSQGQYFSYKVTVPNSRDAYTITATNSSTQCTLSLNSNNQKSANNNCHGDTRSYWK